MSSLITALWVAVLVVPGVLRMLSYTLVMPIAINETNAVPLSASTERMYGHRGKMLLAGLVVGLPALIGAISVGWLVALVSGTEPSERVLNAAGSLVTPVLMMPLSLLASVAHLKLRMPPANPF